ncbi:MAG: class I SAM-dependent methyltransferase [Planctomycetota bacterium]|nr:methyltransferase domain-containing protein [Planctomycetota bacterium]MCB9901696.1 methyltransferase domain-containing protein [Planctomycetota bacterium]
MSEHDREAVDVSMRTRALREEVSEKFFKGTGATYDRVVAWTTLGLDKRWKKRLWAQVPTDAHRILDLACGTGIVLGGLHRRAPNAQLVGVDFTADYIEVARQRMAATDADVTFVHANAEEMQLEGTFDVVVSSYIPKYVDPDVLLDRLAPHVEPGTVLAFHDFAFPRGGARFLWRRWMRLIGWLGPKIWPAWKVCFDENLEQLIEQSKWHRTYPKALEARGWVDVRMHKLSWRTAILVTARRPGARAEGPSSP